MFDVWHVSKGMLLCWNCNSVVESAFILLGLLKKLDAAAYERGCFAIQPWISSINNHLYWCAATCRDQEQELKVTKWRSVINHMQDIHEGHNPQFPRCQHPPIKK